MAHNQVRKGVRSMLARTIRPGMRTRIFIMLAFVVLALVAGSILASRVAGAQAGSAVSQSTKPLQARAESPSTGDDYLLFVPQGGAPPNGGSIPAGSRFVVDLWLNAESQPALAQQSYLTFTNSLLQNANVSSINTSCVLTSTLTGDRTTFDTVVQ